MEKVESIKVKKVTKEKLVKLAGELERKWGRRVSIDEVINYLIERKNKELAESIFGIAKGMNLYEELRKGREEDNSN